MVMRHFGSLVSLYELRSRFPIHRGGATLAQIAGYAKEVGFAVRGLKLECGELGSLKTPAVLHWDLDHFVVLQGLRGRRLVIADPAVGLQALSLDEVSRHFTGVALELWPGREHTPLQHTTRRLGLRQIWKEVSGSTQNIAWILVLSIALQLLLLIGPWHVQWLVDEALMQGDVHLVGVLALGFGVLLGLRVVVYWLRGSVVIELGHGLSFSFTGQLLDRLLRLPLNWFHRRSVGDIISRFGSLQPIRDFFTQGAANFCVDATLVLLSLVLMVIYQWQLAALVTGLQGIYVAGCLILAGRIREQSMRVVVTQAREQSQLMESVRSVNTVTVYSQEEARLHAWQKLHADTLSSSMSLQRTQLGLMTMSALISGLELLLVVSLGGLRVLEGQGFSIGMLMAFLSYRGYFSGHLRAVSEHLMGIKTLSVHLARLEDVWFESPEPRLTGRSRSSEPDRLFIKNVSFCYPGGNAVLEGVDLVIPPGGWIAIVGESGSGKSTLLRIMMGLLVPEHGEVVVGKKNLIGHHAVAFRRQCGCVLQEDGLFSGSIADNIALFTSPDQMRVREVLMQVGMLEVVDSLPLGMLTQTGDIGSNMSSGQLQRIYLARALYRKPAYLFLDEATVNLDSASVEVINDVLRTLTCTIITVTHDSRLAVLADEVWRMWDGHLKKVEG